MKSIYIYDKNLNCIFKPFITTIEEFENDKNRFYSNWDDTMYYSEILLENPIIDNGKLRNKTNIELIKEGKVKLPEGQYLENDEIIISEIPTDLVIPYWDKTNNTWVEKASEQELLQKELDERKKFYIKERGLASIFITEFICGINNDSDTIKEVKQYLKDIHPDNISNNNKRSLLRLNKVNRPKILESIEKEVKNV